MHPRKKDNLDESLAFDQQHEPPSVLPVDSVACQLSFRTVQDIKTHLDFLVWVLVSDGKSRSLLHPQVIFCLAEERYNETHGCNDIWGTAERCFKNCDGHVMEIQDLVP